jgi:Linear amide C-N hydrolases, choloylglycine hydrolase family
MVDFMEIDFIKPISKRRNTTMKRHPIALTACSGLLAVAILTTPFHRASACTQTADPREAVATVFSVMRNTSVPRGISAPDAPNIAPTIWRTVSDQKNLVYYFEDTTSPSPVWVKLTTLDFKEGSGVRKLSLFGNPDLGGDQTTNFKKSEPFKFTLPHLRRHVCHAA